MCHFEYTTYTLPDIIKFVSDLSDTNLHFSENIRRIMRRTIVALNFCLIENDKIPPNLNARAGKNKNIYPPEVLRREKKVIFLFPRKNCSM